MIDRIKCAHTREFFGERNGGKTMVKRLRLMLTRKDRSPKGYRGRIPVYLFPGGGTFAKSYQFFSVSSNFSCAVFTVTCAAPCKASPPSFLTLLRISVIMPPPQTCSSSSSVSSFSFAFTLSNSFLIVFGSFFVFMRFPLSISDGVFISCDKAGKGSYPFFSSA